MKNNTKNNTNKTIKQMFLAASVALTMGVASATSVPGIGTNVFEFSKPGVASDAVVQGFGVDSIANINAILDAVGNTGGGSLDQAAFWGSATAKSAVDVFEYDAAAPMIEELIFTVKGEARRADGVYLEASLVDTFVDIGNGYNENSNKRADFLRKTSSSTAANGGVNGLYVEGKLSHTKSNAFDLLTMLKFNVTDRVSANDGTGTTDITSQVEYSGPHSLIEKSVILNEGTDGLKEAVDAAALNKEGFQNANHLVALIAAELKTGYILDVDKATANLALIADHHTGMLSEALVEQAHSLKAVLRNIGYLEAAVGVGKGTEAACVDNNGTTQKGASACTTIGGKFVTLTANTTDFTNAGVMADGYNDTLSNITAFADHIIGFNGIAGGFNATDEAAAINSQFGTITVTAGSDLHNQLEADKLNGTTTAPTEADITGNAADSSTVLEAYALFADITTGLDLDADGAFDMVFDEVSLPAPVVVTPATGTNP